MDGPGEVPIDIKGVGIDKAKELLGDRKLLNEKLEELKDNKTLMPLVMKKFNTDQRIKRNMTNAAAELNEARIRGARKRGQHDNKDNKGMMLNRREKTKKLAEHKAAYNAEMRAKADARLTQEDKECILITPTGNIRPFYMKDEEISDEKYCIHSCYLDETAFVVLSNIGLGGQRNNLATELLNDFVDGEQTICHGQIIFVGGRVLELPVNPELAPEPQEVTFPPIVLELKASDSWTGSLDLSPTVKEVNEDEEEIETYTKFIPMKITMKKFAKLCEKEMDNRKKGYYNSAANIPLPSTAPSSSL